MPDDCPGWFSVQSGVRQTSTEYCTKNGAAKRPDPMDFGGIAGSMDACMRRQCAAVLLTPQNTGLTMPELRGLFEVTYLS